jgi:hypothetical protein
MSKQNGKNTTEKDLFHYLTRKDKSRFDESIINNWYIARKYVQDKLEDVIIGPESGEHLHAVIYDDMRDEMMLCVLRQVALSAHYANFDEVFDDEGGQVVYKCKNRSVITFVTDREGLEQELKKEEYLCNLLDYCEYSFFGGEPKHKESYLDIELHIVSAHPTSQTNNEIVKEMKREDLACLESRTDVREIDTRKAVYADRMYHLGDEIGNLPAEDIHNAHRYQQALDKFQYVIMAEPWKPMVDNNEWNKNLSAVKEALSNLFCADCFESRKRGIEQSWAKEERRKKKGEGDKSLKNVVDVWEKYNEALSRSEHARWMVEKFIMGYRVMDTCERLKFESYLGQKRKTYLKSLKKNASDPAHIDLCSYHDLRRVDPDNMKYDSFLMLAIPKILEKTKLHEKK